MRRGRGLRSVLVLAILAGFGVRLPAADEAALGSTLPKAAVVADTVPNGGLGEVLKSAGDALSDLSWMRFETIAVGSFPITLFYVGFGFDLGGWLSHGFDPLYSPWPFKNPQAPAQEDNEKLIRLSGAVVLSLGIAILDAIFLPRAVARREMERGRGPFPMAPLPARFQGGGGAEEAPPGPLPGVEMPIGADSGTSATELDSPRPAQ